jgi:hypothetical protein
MDQLRRMWSGQPEDAGYRSGVLRAMHAQSMELSELNVEYGYCYQSAAVVPDGSTEPAPDLDSIEQAHKDEVIGQYDAAVIDKEDGKPHVAKRMDRPHIRVIPEWFGGGTLPRNELHEAAA